MKQDEAQIYKRIKDFEIEENIRMFNSTYGNLWPIFKMHIIRRLLSKQSKIKYRNNIYRTLSKLKTHLRAIKNYKFKKFKLLELDTNTSEIWFSNHELRYENSEKYNKYLDPFFIELSTKNAVIYEGTANYAHEFTFSHLEGKNIKNINPVLLRYNNRYLLKKTFSFYKDEYNIFKKTNYAKVLIKYFYDCGLYSIFLEYIDFVEYYKFYTYFFSKYPKVRRTYIVAYYMTSRMAMIAVANSKNIKTIDIQHNVMTKIHYAYGAWDYIPIGGYGLLPKCFYVFSEKETALLNGVFKGKHEVEIVNNYTYKFWKNEKKAENKDKKDVILISLQNEVISKDSFLLKALLEINKKRKDIKIVFRLHPRHIYIKKETEDVLNKIGLKFFWDVNSEIYDTLLNTLLNLTSFSSVVNDALLFNIPSILYTEKGMLAYEEELKNNKLVQSALNLKEILNHINKYI